VRARHLLGFAISAVCLWLAVRQVNATEFLHATASADPRYVALAAVLTVTVCVFRAARWRLLFSPTKDIPFSSLFSVIMIGFLANNVLPARLGELVMVFLVDRKEHVGKTRTAATIALDRFLDVATLVGFLTVAMFIAPVPDWVRRMAWIGIALLVLAAGTAWSLLAKRELWQRLADGMFAGLARRWSIRMPGTLAMLAEGLAVARDVRAMVRAVLLSVLVWTTLALAVFCLFVAFGFELSPLAAVTTLAIVNLGLILPSSPGFIGTFQLFCVISLGLFGIGDSAALSFATIYHLTQWLPTTLLGFYFLGKENLKMAAFTKLEAA
jgi:uncharacterized protein (TIRG00374 family)